MTVEVVTKSGPGATAPAPQKTVTPTPVPTAAPSAPPVDVETIKRQLADERRMRDVMLVRQKAQLEGAAKKEREGLGSKMTRLAELEKERAQAKLNPEAFLKSVYGENEWYDTVISAKLNNGVPNANVLADEIARVEERVEAKWKARDEKAAADAAERSKSELAGARRQVVAEATVMWKATGADYPLISEGRAPEDIAKQLQERMENHYFKTIQRDEEGRVLIDGQMLPLQKVAELWEGELVALAEVAAKHPKYAAKFQPQAVKVAPQNVESQPRRTLSNDLTGRTPARSAPANDFEKRARAIAAYEGVRKPNT